MANLPENKQQTVTDFFKYALRLDGTIDGRSLYGRSLRAIQDELDEDQYQAAAAMLKRDVAMLSVIGRAIETYLLSNPKLIITKDGLNPMVKDDLIRIQDAKRRALNSLLDLKKKQRGKEKIKKGRDLDAISFE